MDYTGRVKGDLTDLIFLQNKVNEFCERQYGFDVDQQTDIDSIDMGNLMRFANNCFDQGFFQKGSKCFQSELKIDNQGPSTNMANIRPRIQFNGKESTAQFYAIRNIKANEELFFDYNLDLREPKWLKEYKRKFLIE